MGRNTKYSEELKCDAVIRFSEIERGKIKPTELAAWASQNVPGLEGIDENHFYRQKMKNGVLVKSKCQILIDEINKAREFFVNKTNYILYATDLTEFHKLPFDLQDGMIRMTRVTVSNLKKQKLELQKNVKRLENELELKNEMARKIKEFEKNYETLKRRCQFLMEELEDEKCRSILKKHGFHDDWLSLAEYRESLANSHDEIMDINRELERYFKYKPVIEEYDVEPEEQGSVPENCEVVSQESSPTAISDFFFSNSDSKDSD